MADDTRDAHDAHDHDDPFLERRLATLATLPVPERPTLETLAARGDDGEAVGVDDPIAGQAQRRSHRVWMLSAAAVVLVVLVVAIAAVARRGDVRMGVADGGLGESLAGREFWSVAVTEDGLEREMTDNAGQPTKVWIRFSPDRPALLASAGCNTLNAGFSIDSSRLVLDPGIGTTEVACYGPIAEQDSWLSEFLQSSPTIALDGDRLTLTSGSTVIELLDHEVADPDRPLAGTHWELSSIVRGESVSSPPHPGAWMVLTDTGTTTWDVMGSDGCNGFRGTIEVDGDRIGPMLAGSELRACEGMYDDDPDPVVVLDGGATYAIDGSELRIVKGDRGLVYRADDERAPSTDTTVPAPDAGPTGTTGPTGTDAPGTTAAAASFLDQGWWTTYAVAEDDRTVTFTMGVTYRCDEVFDHAELDDSVAGLITVKAVVSVPAGPTLDPACDMDTPRTFVLVLDEPLAGRIIIGPPSKPLPPPTSTPGT